MIPWWWSGAGIGGCGSLHRLVTVYVVNVSVVFVVKASAMVGEIVESTEVQVVVPVVPGGAGLSSWRNPVQLATVVLDDPVVVVRLLELVVVVVTIGWLRLCHQRCP
jgi:hypothetical protein